MTSGARRRSSDVSLSHDEQWAFIHENWAMVIGTVGRDGHPHLVTMSYGFEDGRPVFTTYSSAQKSRNIARDPRITCLVESVGDHYSDIRGVQLIGRAEFSNDPAMVRRCLRAVIDQMILCGRDVPSDTPAVDHLAVKRVAVVVHVERTISWDHARARS